MLSSGKLNNAFFLFLLFFLFLAICIQNSANSSASSALLYDASSAYYNAMYSAPPPAPYMLFRPLAPILLYPPPAPILLYLPPAPIMLHPLSPYPAKAAPNPPLPHGSHCPYGNCMFILIHHLNLNIHLAYLYTNGSIWTKLKDLTQNETSQMC